MEYEGGLVEGGWKIEADWFDFEVALDLNTWSWGPRREHVAESSYKYSR